MDDYVLVVGVKREFNSPVYMYIPNLNAHDILTTFIRKYYNDKPEVTVFEEAITNRNCHLFTPSNYIVNYEGFYVPQDEIVVYESKYRGIKSLTAFLKDRDVLYVDKDDIRKFTLPKIMKYKLSYD